MGMDKTDVEKVFLQFVATFSVARQRWLLKCENKQFCHGSSNALTKQGILSSRPGVC